MANPQAENGYTAIANEIVEHLWMINLSAYETRVLWYLFRKTYGWNKKTDRIALSQFAKEIGIDRRLIHRALRGLSSKQMIVIYKDDKNIVTYGFQKNYEKWKLSSKEMTVINRDDKVSSKEMTKVSSKEIPTKTNKTTIQKKTTSTFILPPDIEQKIWDAFCEMRTKLKSPLTEHAKGLILGKLVAIGQDKNSVLNQSIERGWKGVFELKDTNGTKPHGTVKTGADFDLDEFMREVKR